MKLLDRMTWIREVGEVLGASTEGGSAIRSVGRRCLAADALGRAFRAPCSFSWRGHPFEVIIERPSDFGTLHEVFVEEQYAADLAQPVRVLLDAGSNFGASALYFSLCYPEARIVCVEADPNNFRRLQENMAAAPGAPRITCLHRAVWKEAGSVRFHVNPQHGNSSSMYARRGKEQLVEVRGETLAGLCREAGIDGVDLLKLDIEGAEYEVASEAFAPERFPNVVAELHLDLWPVDTLDESMFAGYDDARLTAIAPERYLVACRSR